MKYTLLLPATLLLFSLGFNQHACAQATACPSVNAGPDLTICGGCATLNAAIQGTRATTSYTVNAIPYNPFPFNVGTPILIGIDDIWSDTIVLPFCFQFFGNTYTRCIIGSNGVISFNTSNANNYNTWPINAAVPSALPADLQNCIMGPWHDIDPGVGGTIYWQVLGTAPCRRLVVSWNQVPMFSCTTMINTQQTVLYETTNVIDVFIQNKPVCSTWNGGAAIEAIQNQGGTVAYVVPGRNYPTQWTATNDGYRFAPSGAPQYTITWLQNGNPIGTNPSITVCPTTTTTYVAQVVNQTCSGPITVTDTVVLNIGVGSLTLTTNSTPTTCTGSTGTATVTPTGTAPFTYSWSPGGQTTQTITGLPAGTYTVLVTAANGCQASSSVTVVASNNNINLSSSITPTNCTANNGTATVTPTGGQTPYTYSWGTLPVQTAATATGLATGTYSVIVTDANGCTATATVTIMQASNNLAATITAPAPVCFGQSASLTANVTGGTSPYSYSWAPGNMTTSSVTVTPTITTSYNCYVTDVNGCTTMQNVMVTIDPAITATVNGTNTICRGSSTSITATVSGGTPGYTYSWVPSGGTGSAISVTPTSTTTYSVVVTDALGCTRTSGGVTITVNPKPVANFGTNPPTTTPTLNVNFTDLSTISSGSVTAWSWSFGDGGNSILQNPVHAYAVPGTYTVCLFAYSTICRDSICRPYVVEPTDITVPNVITPNGDGKNDSLIFKNLEFYPNSDLKIYDRWGLLIYSSSNYKNDWQGGKIPDGTYYFILTVPGLKDPKKGFLEVLSHM